jgi:acyl carrier protein
MDPIRSKLVSCFQTVFPDLSEAAIPTAQQDAVEAWDSVATITLVQVIEDEFRTEVDLERLSELTSFEAIAGYLEASLKTD